MSNDFHLLPQIGVGTVTFRNNKVLLVKRGTPPSEGLWAIPGGRLELGETFRHAAERETLEETGVVVRALDPVYTFDIIERDSMGKILYHYVIVDFAAEYVSGVPKASDDASDARWITPEELSTLEVNDKTRHLLNDICHFR
jgi:ADP-ribose pyrophosphatase